MGVSLTAMLCVINSERISGMQKLAAIVLANYADEQGGKCFPSMARIAKHMGLSPAQARRHVRQLTNSGLVLVESEGRSRGLQGNSSRRYRLDLRKIASLTVATTADASPCIEGAQPLPSTHVATTADASLSVINQKQNGQDTVEPRLDAATPGRQKRGRHRNDAKALLKYLNDVTGRAYRPVDANLGLIIARLEEGATDEECGKVIKEKAEQWLGDEKMVQYLRPKTLFNRTNFAQYMGELGTLQAPSTGARQVAV